ncbi:MAG: peroxide stress protein YaaA [Paludibacteraceae bacterium]
MIVLLSPAKIQNFKPQHQVAVYTLPDFLSKSTKLIDKLKTLSITEVADLLKINFKIAEQIHNSHFVWNKKHTSENSKQTAWVFNGEAYKGLETSSFSEKDIDYAQTHLRILSGLYGILRPLDLIQHYRLDVGDETSLSLGENLYEFWKTDVNKTLAKMLDNTDEPKVILNLMSKEYSKLLDRKNLNARVIDIEFLEYQPDTEKYKPIVIYIKKARGLMAKYVLKNKITDIEYLKAFSEEGYWFNEQLSSENTFVFTR